MPRSQLSRSVEPLVAVLWGTFLIWTVWLAVVWIAPVGTAELGFFVGQPAPPNADLRRAVLLLAENADIAWLALAVMNLHLVLMRTHGLRTTRMWMLLSAGGGFVLGALNVKTGLIFGTMQYGSVLGLKLLGVAIGWVFLWSVLVPGTREAVLWIRPRASHRSLAILTALVVSFTVFNLEWPVRSIRGWWLRTEDVPGALGLPWQNWFSWVVWPGLMALAMREPDVRSGVAPRSGKPVVVLAALNAIALAARLRFG